MKAACLQFNNLDDRRQIHHLLTHLPPRDRIRWLKWCCKRATVHPGSPRQPVVDVETAKLARLAYRDDSADRRLSMEVFLDGWALAVQYHLDLTAALAQLVQMVKGKT